MVHRRTTAAEAYAILGLEQGASLEAVKTAYKQLALRTHPDKNPNNPDATIQFQQVGEAYHFLLKHLDRSTPPPMSHPFHGFSPFASHGRPPSYGSDYADDDEYDSDFEEYYDDSEGESHEQEDLDFFMFLFEEMLNGRANRFAGARFKSRGRDYERETEEQYKARIRRQHEEQVAAAQRRKAQEEAWKQRRQMERESEARAGAERRKQRAEAKKADAEASRKSAAVKVRDRQQKSQMLRSAVFAAARRGDGEKVRKGVWEEGVDAAGGEIKPGMDAFVESRPDDPKQTLLHLAVIHGDLELVEWLDRHNAEADERDSRQRTAFNVALQYGRVAIIRYFFTAYPPGESDSDSVLHAHESDKSLLRLALDSGEPEVVWLVLDAGLADGKAVRDAWTWICTVEGRRQFGSVGPCGRRPFDQDKFEETKELLMTWGRLTPPPTPPQNESTDAGVDEKISLPQPKKSNKNMMRKKHTTTLQQAPQLLTPQPSPPSSQAASPSTSAQPGGSPFTARGRGNGRERGRGRRPGRSTA